MPTRRLQQRPAAQANPSQTSPPLPHPPPAACTATRSNACSRSWDCRNWQPACASRVVPLNSAVRVTFSEAVEGVGPATFCVTTVDGAACDSASVVTGSVTVESPTSAVFQPAAGGWLAAVQSMRRLELDARLWPNASAALFKAARSSMGRHVAVLDKVRIDAATLLVVAERMAHLRALHCDLDLALPALGPADSLRFPVALCRLNVQVLLPAGSTRINAVIAAIAQLPLLEDLTITLPAKDSLISFAPLAALPQLRRLEIGWARRKGKLSDAQVDQLRALPHLRDFSMEVNRPLFRRLIRQPHDLQWQQISLPRIFDDEAAAVLPQLPSLTKIYAGWLTQRFDWLRGLPNLTDVHLLLGTALTAGRTDSMVAGLQHCTNIHTLALTSCSDLTPAHLAELLPRLPRLRALELSLLPIDSLSFLSQAPLTTQLSSLTLIHCHRLPLSELHHAHSLRGLKRLQLGQSFSTWLDAHGRSLLTPPSAVLPLLEFFHYSAP